MKRSLARPLCIALALPALTGMPARPALAAGSPEGKPDFPPVDEALKIERAQIPIGYPRVMAGFQAGFSVIDAESMDNSIDDSIAELGGQSETSLPERGFGVGFTLGMRMSYRFGLGVETHWVTDSNAISTSYFGGLATVVLTPERSRSYSVAVGAGIGRQLISMDQSYNVPLPPNLTLTSVSYDSEWETVVPLAVILELPNHRYSRYALVTTLQHLFGDKRSVSLPTYYGVIRSVPFEVDFGGWLLTIGLRVGL